jgi:hypothetical protein
MGDCFGEGPGFLRGKFGAGPRTLSGALGDHVNIALVRPLRYLDPQWKGNAMDVEITTQTEGDAQARLDFASVYRLLTHHGWGNVIFNHAANACSLRPTTRGAVRLLSLQRDQASTSANESAMTRTALK